MLSLNDLIEEQPQQVIELLLPHISSDRIHRLQSVVRERTDTIATVVEGLINRGNVSAVMRSAEALGFYKFHVIEGGEKFKNSTRTSQGAEKWLDVQTWASPAECIGYLKNAGYTVVATHLSDQSVPIDELDFTQRTALVFGNEAGGVSPETLALADQLSIIPMTGFVQSFNISVAAAVALYHAYRDRIRRQGYNGDLTDEERLDLLARYCVKGVKNAEKILESGVGSLESGVGEKDS